MAGTVRVEPLGVEIGVADGESLLAAARRQGLIWPSVCGGKADCATCYVRLLAGHDHVSDGEEKERTCLLHNRGIDLGAGTGVRLACQLRVRGDVTVRKLGVRVGR